MSVSDILSGAFDKAVAKAPGAINAAVKSEVTTQAQALIGKVNSKVEGFLSKHGVPPPGGARHGSLTRPDSVLQQAISRPDPLLQWQWRVAMPFVEGFQIPDIYIEQISFSPAILATDEYKRRGKSYYLAGEESTNAISISLYEDVRLTSTTYFMAWKNLTRNPTTGLHNLVNIYKRDIIVDAIGLDGTSIASFVLQGCFPTSPNSGQFQFGSNPNERIQVTTELSVDDIIFYPRIDILHTDIGAGYGDSLLKNGLNYLPNQSTDLKTRLLQASGLAKLAHDAAGSVKNAAANVLNSAAGNLTNGVKNIVGGLF